MKKTKVEKCSRNAKSHVNRMSIEFLFVDILSRSMVRKHSSKIGKIRYKTPNAILRNRNDITV